MIILRSCNELLRRLSRAENTVFCGRVFIFLFQSFPLGDKSSVNLRGEFHVENTTTYEESPPNQVPQAEGESMDVDMDEKAPQGIETAAAAQSTSAPAEGSPTVASGPANGVKLPVLITPVTKAEKKDEFVELDALYPIFWSLQRDFSNPTRLFDSTNFGTFKQGIGNTIETFTKMQRTLGGGATARASDERKQGTKRKRGEGDDELASGFNPKYLTSRDLFELEVRTPSLSCEGAQFMHHPTNLPTDERSGVQTTYPRSDPDLDRLPPLPPCQGQGATDGAEPTQ